MQNIFNNHKIDCVIHFAGYKAVGESCKEPLKYYQNNMISTFNLIEVMNKYGCKNIIFSSSATVYAVSEIMPLDETFPLSASNPYGRTKLFNEHFLIDYQSLTPFRLYNPYLSS